MYHWILVSVEERPDDLMGYTTHAPPRFKAAPMATLPLDPT